MNLYEIVFYFFAIVTVGSAAVVVFSRNIIYSAFSLLFTFFGVAGLYVLLNADFLAVTQLLIYVGGILVLLLFGVMLTSNTISVELKTGTLHILPATILVALLVGLLTATFWTADWFMSKRASDIAAQTTSKEIGDALVTTHLLPFEIASIILLVAIVGAAMMARRENPKSQIPI
ncbi:MAG: NADH-quinone oxidoreductase subunit J [Ignavibacteriales bacterium]|nr:NADH-quinone oxidoreductase subunit J [Ignavibacteriales bacterium]